MAKKIIWTNKAKRELIDILKYWVEEINLRHSV